MKIGILPYSSSNTANVKRLFTRTYNSSSFSIMEIKDVYQKVDLLVLPGVGNFEFVIKEILSLGFTASNLKKNFPKIFGICLGMHLMNKDSEESSSGYVKGWSFFNKSVKSISILGAHKKVHTGWNYVTFTESRYKNLDGYYYFSHSFGIEWNGDIEEKAYYVINDKKFIALIKRNELVGVQFHPELSGEKGRLFLRSILDF